MNLYLRLLLVWLRNFRRSRRHYKDVTESRFRVLPHDLDAFGHMNNGRYLQIMDVARTEWMLQTGVAAAIRRQRWVPLLGGGMVRFRYSLNVLQRYCVSTRLVGWDERWFYTEHAFVDETGRCVAVGMTRAALRTVDGWVDTAAVVEAVHPGAEPPHMPRHVREWLQIDEEWYRGVADMHQLDRPASCTEGGC